MEIIGSFFIKFYDFMSTTVIVENIYELILSIFEPQLITNLKMCQI